MKTAVSYMLAFLLIFLSACPASFATINADQSGVASAGAGPKGSADDPLQPITYPSVAAMLDGLSSGIPSDKLREIEAKENSKGAFKNFMDRLLSDYAVFVPYADGKPAELRSAEGYSAIAIFPVEQYGKPWICYLPDERKDGVYCVFMMILDDDIVAEANKNGAPWLMEHMNPNGTGKDVTPYPCYDDIAEREISLKGRTVKALVGHYRDDPRDFIHFVYDDVFVRLIIMPGAAGENWIGNLSFRKVPLDADIDNFTGESIDGASDAAEDGASDSTADGATDATAKGSASRPAPQPTAKRAITVRMMFTLDNTLYTVNEEVMIMDVAPTLKEDRTLLPIRFVAEPLGAEVSWDDAEQKATVTLIGRKIELWIGKNAAKVNDVDVRIDPGNANVKPLIISDRTMLPLRFVAETLGCDVQWFGDTEEILVTYPK